MALVLWPSYKGAPVGDGGPITALSGEVVLTELGQFSGHTVVLAAANERAILAMREYTLIELEQTGDGALGVGTIQYGYVINPRQQITDRDEHTITLELAPLTAETTWRHVRRGWKASNFLSVVASRLATIVPGWTSHYTGDPTDLVTGGDFQVTVTPSPGPVLGAYLATAKIFGQLVRQGVDAFGVPTRIFEMGQFAAPPTMYLTTANGSNPDEIDTSLNRLVATVDRQPNDVTTLVNVCVPFGGGADADSLVTLERCWRIVNDPTYIHAGRFGTDEQSMARTGMATVLNNGDNPIIAALPFQAGPSYSSAFIANLPLGTNVSFLSTSGGWSNVVYNGTTGYVDARYLVSSLFPEYDDADPISDPLNPPTGQLQWLFTDVYGNVFADQSAFTVEIGPRGADGIVPLNVWDSSGLRPDVIATFVQGAYNTRAFTVDGRGDYVMFDRTSYALYDYKEGQLIDSSVVATDKSVASQEEASRALYIATKTNFLRRAHPHHVFSCTTPGMNRPTRAGDLIAVDVRRVSVQDDGAVVEMDVVDELKVNSWTRSFNGDEVPQDRVLVSNNGRFEDDDTTDGAVQAQQLIAFAFKEGTGLSGIRLPWPENIDAANPIIIPFYIVPEHFQFHQVRVQVDFYSFRGTATTAANIQGTPIISADVEIELTTANPINARAANIGGVPLHVHRTQTHVDNAAFVIPSVPFSEVPAGYLHVKSADGKIYSNTFETFLFTDGGAENIIDAVLDPTLHPHVVADEGDVMAHIPAGQRIADVPEHVHDVEKRIPTGQPSPASITMSIDGIALSSGISATGTRDTSGAFTSSFVVNDIGALLDAHASGSTVPLQFDAGTSESNPFGVGYLRIMITGVEELGGLTSTFRPS